MHTYQRKKLSLKNHKKLKKYGDYYQLQKITYNKQEKDIYKKISLQMK